MIKAITFDVDNTLLDFMEFKRKTVTAMVKALKRYGFKGSQKNLEKDLFDFYLRYGIESGDFLEKYLQRHDKKDDVMLAAAINAYVISKYQNLKPYPKVRTTLKKLKNKGIKLAIVTDAPRIKAIMRLEALGIARLFDAIVSAEDVKRKKPSTLPFKKALKTINVRPEEALHVGDWRDKDILGAKRAGMQTCIALYGDLKIGKKVRATYYIRKFEDILHLI